MNHHIDGSLATLLEHVPPSRQARALIDHHSSIADQFVNQIAAEELLAADAVQASTSPVGPRNTPADAVRVDYQPDGRFRLVRSGVVWTVEEEIAPGTFKQHDGHYQSKQAAHSYIKKGLVRREFGLPSGVSGSAVPVLDEAKFGRILTDDDVRAIVREEIQAWWTGGGSVARLRRFHDDDPSFKGGDSLDNPDLERTDVHVERPEVVVELQELQLVDEAPGDRETAGNVGQLRHVHDASPSVGEFGDLTVGDGQAAEGDLSPSAAEPSRLVAFACDGAESGLELADDLHESEDGGAVDVVDVAPDFSGRADDRLKFSGAGSGFGDPKVAISKVVGAVADGIRLGTLTHATTPALDGVDGSTVGTSTATPSMEAVTFTVRRGVEGAIRLIARTDATSFRATLTPAAAADLAAELTGAIL